MGDAVGFAYTGQPQDLVVPTGVSTAKISMRGADGVSTGPNYATNNIRGGQGYALNLDMPVEPGDTLTIGVGGTGNPNNGNKSPGAGGWGMDGYGGGRGGSGKGTVSDGGGGGGATVLELNGAVVAVAAGGGGAGWDTDLNVYGGDGGWQQGEDGGADHIGGDGGSATMPNAITGQSATKYGQTGGSGGGGGAYHGEGGRTSYGDQGGGGGTSWLADGTTMTSRRSGSGTAGMTVAFGNDGRPMLGPSGTEWAISAAGGDDDQVLEADGASTADGTAVDTSGKSLTPDGVAANELWVYKAPASVPGSGQLINKNSGKCLEINAISHMVDQWTCHPDASNQLWQLRSHPDGAFALWNSTGVYLATAAGGLGNGPRTGISNEQNASTAWNLERDTPDLGPTGTVWAIAKTGTADTQLLQVRGGSGANGAAVETWRNADPAGHPQDTQLWTYQADDSGYGELVNKNTGKCLEFNGTNGSLDQWTCQAGANNHLWRAIRNSDGGISLQIQFNRSYLATEQGQIGNGTRLTTQPDQSDDTSWTLRLAR